MKPKIKSSLMVLDKGEFIQIGLLPGKAVRIQNDGEVKALLNLMNGKNTIEKIAQKLGKSREDVQETISQLREFHLVEDTENETILSELEVERYKRNLSFFSLFVDEKFKPQERLKNSRVLLIGLGGGGSQLVYSLLSLGVGYIKAIDFDKVERHNLNRQILYTESDIGKQKVDAALERAKEIQPNSKFEVVNDRIDTPEKADKYIRDVDVVLLTADGPVYYIYKWVNEVCVKRKIPWISFGVVETRAMAGPFVIPGETLCYNCTIEEKMAQEPMFLEDVELINKNPEIFEKYVQPSVIPMFGILANYIAMDLLYFLTGIKEPKLKNKMLVFDAEKGEFSFEKISAKRCSLCKI